MKPTLTEAKLLESQGYLVDAVETFKKLNASELKKYENINPKLLEFFIRMKKDEDFEKFKRWLFSWK